MAVTPAIETVALRKVYEVTKKQPGFWGTVKGLVRPVKEELEAVKSIDLSIQPGEIVGFLGPNGAGKTTTIKMLSGIMHPTSGQASVLGFEPWKRHPDMLRRIALVMGNKQQLWWDLPAIESFNVLRVLYDVPDSEYRKRLDHLAESLQLTERLETQVRKLSLGERMKCELVAALLHQPEVVFLDEPTIGLDLVSQKRIREFLRDLNQQTGCTIVLTSHYMQDVVELAQRVVVIDRGSLVFDGEINQLVNLYGSDRQLRLTFAGEGELPDLSLFGRVLASEGREVTLSVAKQDVAHVSGKLLQAYSIVDIAIEEVAVEEVVRRLFEEGR